MKKYVIACVDINGGIGKDNKLVILCRKDMNHFVRTTKNNIIVMGRKTFESLNCVPLSGRRNVIITSRYIEGLECYSTVEDAIDALERDQNAKGKDIYYIGGATLYNYVIEKGLYDGIILTKFYIDTECDSHITSQITIDADTNLNAEKWHCVSCRYNADCNIPAKNSYIELIDIRR
jgi:dihydrofolate reductase